mmetsp:Transcript_37744/g.61385  ORF Transcript_37744/g.61385 Transcript_37744/m.61385 type:complete len:139 (-) Transcript_37744:365-781(-)
MPIFIIIKKIITIFIMNLSHGHRCYISSYLPSQGWVGVSTLFYALVAAAHLGMMCAWRDIDVDAYEAVPMSIVQTTTTTTYGGGGGRNGGTPTSSKLFSSNRGIRGEGTVPEGDDNVLDGDEYDDTMEFDGAEYQRAI